MRKPHDTGYAYPYDSISRFGHFWPFLAIFGSFLPLFDPFFELKSMAKVGDFTFLGIFWHFSGLHNHVLELPSCIFDQKTSKMTFFH